MLTNTWSARRAIFEMVPRDMRTADPTRGAELAEGYFALGDASIELDGRNLFDVAPPSERFAALLHSFRWLRHMRAHAHPGTKLLARTYVLQWVAKRREHPRIAMAPDVAAKRALCLTNQAAYLLDDADSADYRAIMESIIADVRLAFTHRALIADPTERCAIALSCASVANALTGHKALQRKTLAVLDRSLRDALHRDGGPVTRRPTDLAQLLAEMLSLRALLEARNVPIPQRLTMGITDAMRTMRMLRHPDGSLARFQGAADLTHLARGLVASITTYDTERGPLPAEAPETGYVRLEGTSGLVLADVGGPPAVNAGSRAHASCLAFEWSIGAEKVVTNSPPPWQGRFSNQLDHRRTMAHSTVSMDGQSSAQFATPELDSPIVSAGFTVSHTLDKSDGEATLSAQHTGYRKRYGVDHARTLTLSPSGRQLEGKDSFQLKTGTPARTVRTPYTLHFHLEPGLRVKMLGEQSCRITTAMRTILFEVDQGQLRVTDPGHEDYHGPAQSIELSVSSTPAELPEISWRFRVERQEGAQVDAEATAVEEVEAPA
ncbi:MAG: heparinase II/III family protein, partial [Devosiaceae bacterium]|nr:heparinase II/III family protein [Devosiaceae bacterium MH13]